MEVRLNAKIEVLGTKTFPTGFQLNMERKRGSRRGWYKAVSYLERDNDAVIDLLVLH